MKLSEEYRTRSVRFLGIWEFDDWRMKAYGISYGKTLLAQNLVDAAHRIMAERLAVSAQVTNHYGVGFVGIHQGKTGNYVFVDWWADENELHHHAYASSSAQLAELEYITPSGLSACTWDLFLIGHERDAWVRHVLKQNKAPDLEGYLSERLSEDV
jgi:hypothetical protein